MQSMWLSVFDWDATRNSPTRIFAPLTYSGGYYTYSITHAQGSLFTPISFKLKSTSGVYIVENNLLTDFKTGNVFTGLCSFASPGTCQATLATVPTFLDLVVMPGEPFINATDDYGAIYRAMMTVRTFYHLKLMRVVGRVRQDNNNQNPPASGTVMTLRCLNLCFLSFKLHLKIFFFTFF